jgi:hypothetical protein
VTPTPAPPPAKGRGWSATCSSLTRFPTSYPCFYGRNGRSVRRGCGAGNQTSGGMAASRGVAGLPCREALTGGSRRGPVVQSAKHPEVRSHYPRQPKLAPFQGMVPLLPRALGDRAGAGWSGWAPAVPDHLLAEHAAGDGGRAGRMYEDSVQVLARHARAEILAQEDRRRREVGGWSWGVLADSPLED